MSPAYSTANEGACLNAGEPDGQLHITKPRHLLCVTGCCLGPSLSVSNITRSSDSPKLKSSDLEPLEWGFEGMLYHKYNKDPPIESAQDAHPPGECIFTGWKAGSLCSSLLVIRGEGCYVTAQPEGFFVKLSDVPCSLFRFLGAQMVSCKSGHDMS